MCPLPGGTGSHNEQRGFLSRLSAAGVQGMSRVQRQIHRLGVLCLPQTHVSFVLSHTFLQHSGHVSSGQSCLRLWKDFEITSPLLASTGYAASNRKSYLLTDLFNPLNPELNPICYLLALLGAHHFLHVSRIRVKLLTLRRLMSYIYGAPILDVSRSHTTTQHSR